GLDRKTRMFGATVLSVGLAAFLAFSGTWRSIWPLMGTANQLLAALALLAVFVWLKALRTNYSFVKWPAVFMFLVTTTALVLLLVKNLGRHPVLGLLALLLLSFALYVAKAGFFPQTPGRSPQRTL
ncbi:MAG TPA: carbon starvation protein A, partial [Thermodesulfatator atlanticus]|nr:carbon starvation protein A [Thermodesulfatator atlanticus]